MQGDKAETPILHKKRIEIFIVEVNELKFFLDALEGVAAKDNLLS